MAMDASLNSNHPSLPRADTLHLQSAQGWLMLGNPREADAELQQISAACQDHPDVLEIRWLILAQAQQWNDCLKIARQIVAKVPGRPFGWIHQAYALRRVPEGGLQAAWDALLPASTRFPENLTILYNLSCYACQMNKMDDARRLLKEAFAEAKKLRNKEAIRTMALADPDLQPLWDEIRAW